MTVRRKVGPPPEDPTGYGDAPALPVTVSAFVRAVHPDHGATVTYTPGEALPGWVAALLVVDTEPDEQNVIDLTEVSA